MILYLSLFTILISCILIVNNWETNKNVIFLAFLFVILALSGLGQYFVVTDKSVFWTVVFYNNFMPLVLLLGPFLFFYIRGVLIPKKGIRWSDAVHFIPFMINFIAIIPYYLTSYSYKEHLAKNIIANVNLLLVYRVNVLFSPAVNFMLRPICFMIYIVYSFYFIYTFLKQKSDKQGIPFRSLVIEFQWFFGLLVVLIVMLTSFFISSYIFVRTSSYDAVLSHAWYFLVVDASFIIIALNLLFFPHLLYGVSEEVKVNKRKAFSRATNLVKMEPKEGAAFFLNEEAFDAYIEKSDPLYKLAHTIRNFYSEQRPYLKSDFSLGDLAQELNVHENHVLYCFNSVFKISFLKLRNQLRIEYAKELLKNNAHENLTIDAIGQISGFPTRSNFYVSFKNMVGCSPKDYLKSI